jgi:hypothetical protein
MDDIHIIISFFVALVAAMIGMGCMYLMELKKHEIVAFSFLFAFCSYVSARCVFFFREHGGDDFTWWFFTYVRGGVMNDIDRKLLKKREKISQIRLIGTVVSFNNPNNAKALGKRVFQVRSEHGPIFPQFDVKRHFPVFTQRRLVRLFQIMYYVSKESLDMSRILLFAYNWDVSDLVTFVDDRFVLPNMEVLSLIVEACDELLYPQEKGMPYRKYVDKKTVHRCAEVMFRVIKTLLDASKDKNTLNVLDKTHSDSPGEKLREVWANKCYPSLKCRHKFISELQKVERKSFTLKGEKLCAELPSSIKCDTNKGIGLFFLDDDEKGSLDDDEKGSLDDDERAPVKLYASNKQQLKRVVDGDLSRSV